MAKRLTKKQKRRRLSLVGAVICVAIGLLIGLAIGDDSFHWETVHDLWQSFAHQTSQTVTEHLPRPQENRDELHILDVGQGSATLIKSADGHTVLIDSGRHDDGEKRIIDDLDELIGTGNTIDLLIFTHNDSDHIGHGDLILDFYQVGEVWMNGLDHTTRTYLNLLEAIDRSGAEYREPKMGHTKHLGEMTIEIWHPFSDEYLTDQNEASLIGRISLPSFSVVFSGDASYYVEDKIIERVGDVRADYMIAGHHGAHDSTGRNWLEAVGPQAVFYSAGYGNMYGHPHDELIYRVHDEGIPLYGTDEWGRISLVFGENGQLHFSADYPEGRPVEEGGGKDDD